MKQSELKKLKPSDWECNNCITIRSNENEYEDNHERDLNSLNENIDVKDVDFTKYDKMCFDPLRDGSTFKDTKLEDVYHQSNIDCSYVTNDETRQLLTSQDEILTLLNVRIRSQTKNFDKLLMCLKTLNHKFTAIGLSETHLKDKPHEYYNLEGYNFEHVNRIGRKSGGVGMYISCIYKLRQDLCKANLNMESIFIEIDNNEAKNSLLGVVYRSHSAIDNFISDLDPILQTINEEKKTCYIMGDFNIDLLKDDIDRPTHDYLDLIYSHSIIPTILKPTRITKTSATIIDNIITNSDHSLKTAILITDMSDHLPSILMTRLKTTGNNSEKVKKYERK